MYLFFVFVLAVVVFRILGSRGGSDTASRRQVRRALARGRRSRKTRAPRKVFEGVVEGFPVVVEWIANPLSSTALQTRYAVSYPPLGLGLHLRLHRRGDDHDDIQVGDPAFDRTHLVTGGIPSQVRAFLSEARRARIHRVLAAHPGTRITDTGIALVRARTDSNERDMKRVLRDLVQLAQELQRDADPSDPYTAAIEARRAGRLEEAVVHAREAARRGGEVDPGALVLAGESLVVAGRHAEAHEEFEAALEELPDDEEVVVLAAQMRARLDRPPAGKLRDAGLQQQSRPEPEPRTTPAPEPESASEPEPAPAPEPEATPGPEPAAGGAASAALDAATVCEQLFAANRPSYDTTTLFEAEYAGRRVRWTGTLHSVGGYYSDMVFGDGPGTKATLDLGELDGYTGRAARVVVALPKDAEEPLRAARGAALTIEGELLRCDAFMRVVYLADGAYEVE